MLTYFNCHNHTEASNIRLLDSINTPKGLINKAIEYGLKGLAITDHEVLSAHVAAEKHMKKIQEQAPDFKLALGNEIYLINTRDNGQKYYHFILIAKDAIGHRALRELSSHSWLNSYVDRRQERVPTLKNELEEVVNKFPGHLIATTACIGGELSQLALMYKNCCKVEDHQNAAIYYHEIEQFINYCVGLFGQDFYIECAPAPSKDQIEANQILRKIAEVYGIKMTVGTDSHYLTKEDRPIHKAYLNSKEGEREVDLFYEFAYLMSPEEVKENLASTFENDYEFAEQVMNNSLEIYDKIERYSLFHNQDVPEVNVEDYPKSHWITVNGVGEDNPKYPHLSQMLHDDDIQNRYWINQCINKMYELGICDSPMADTYFTELEEEARVKSVISEKLGTNMFRYPNTLQHYINLIWECGSTIGAGRGSSCAALNHYLMGITQLDPIEWDLPFFRYLNDSRVELGDIDIDVCPSKIRLILDKIAEERSSTFNESVPEWAKVLGCTRIATFGTETTKAAITTACRGYRSEDYPEGIDVDEARYMASLIPEERGFQWSIGEVAFGDENKGRKPVQSFLREVNNYPGLLDIIIAIEGIQNKRSSHASGIVLFSNDPFEHCAFMKTPKGEIITQWNLHDVEYMGNVKYDFLVTEVQDKIVQTIKFLQEDGVIEPELSLREVYDKYLHPNVLPKDDPKIWDALDDVSVINIFQFDSQEGVKAAKRLRPRTVVELADANGLMRLMGEEGQLRPIDKYYQYKNNIQLWYDEMARWGLTPEEQRTLEPYFLSSYGVPPSQEQLMRMLMDENICGFTLAEANDARKIVGKKQMARIPELQEKVMNQAKSEKLGSYVWKYGAGPQMGYSFSVIHSLAYSFVGVQTVYLATHFDPIYWDTACLVVNSGSLEEAEVDVEDDEEDQKATSTDYSKIAKALNEIIKQGIKVSLVDINQSDFGFKPDVKNHQILFGMKALLNVNDDLVKEIINNRPYDSIKDFYYKIKPKKQSMVSLIKAGAFDNMMDRKMAMAWFIWETCDKKSRLTLQNMPTLTKLNLVPTDTLEKQFAFSIYEFTRYLKSVCRKSAADTSYKLDKRAEDFLIKIDCEEMILPDETLSVKTWDNFYQNTMDTFREWLKNDGPQVLQKLNDTIFKLDWDKYASGNLSSWEMEVLCFYHHPHELTNVNMGKYGLVNFYDLPEEPIVEKQFKRGNNTINMFKLFKICGTCIAKNKTKGIVSLLTTDGVVSVKFRKEYFALFDKTISEIGEDGKKHRIETSWFNRGSMIMVQGVRTGDTFVSKKYASSGGHQLYKITDIDKDGDISLQIERYKGEGGE